MPAFPKGDYFSDPFIWVGIILTSILGISYINKISQKRFVRYKKNNKSKLEKNSKLGIIDFLIFYLGLNFVYFLIKFLAFDPTKYSDSYRAEIGSERSWAILGNMGNGMVAFVSFIILALILIIKYLKDKKSKK